MKKNKPFRELFYHSLKKTLLIMRIAVILMILGILQARANDAYSQKTKLSFNFSETELVKVLDKIENESQFFFLYNEKLLDTDRKVNIDAKDELISSILDDLFTGTNVKYTIIDRKIILAPDYLTETSDIQQRSVTGTVTDETGNALPGVNIQVEGTTLGAITDINGKYSIGVPNTNAVLIFSFVGYLDSKISLAGRAKIDVTLEPSLESLDEVVVVGYGTQKKKDVTSAIAVVDAKQISRAPVANVTNALMGVTPGVEVTNNTGKPGSEGTIRIRGVASTNNTDPLYVVDGIPMSGTNVNSADIESIQILKDAASCAIYGARGANGVIIITTKSGQSGAPKISYSGYYGVESPWKLYDMMNIDQWAQTVFEGNTAGGKTVPKLATDILNHNNLGTPYQYYLGPVNGAVTNWQKEIFQTGKIEENNLDFSGGTNSGNYYFSVNQFKQDGIIIDTPYERYSIRLNSNWTKNKFKFGENMSFRYFQNEDEDANGGRATIEEMIKITPNIPVLNPNVLGGYSGYNSTQVGHDASNPVGSLMRRTAINYNKLFTSDVYGEYDIFKDLVFRTTFGFTSNDFQKRDLTLKSAMDPKAYPTTTLVERSDWNWSWVLENRLTYHKAINDHDITLMGAYTSEASKNHWFSGTGTNIQTEDNDVLQLFESGFLVGGLETEVNRLSYLGRAMYSYKGKYMLTANFRRDGSSKFGPGKKWGNFPSVSVAWRISEESFLKSIEKIDNLKLRSSYGIVGNDAPILPYAYLTGYTPGTNYAFGTTWATGVTLRNFNNPDLTWETVKQFDIGADLGLFKSKLEISFDYYDKRTEDMLVSLPLPGSSGSASTIARNAGAILNSGFEFAATVHHNVSDLNIGFTVSLATLHNEVLDIYGGNAITAGAVEFGNATRTEVGHPIGAFYGYKTLGVFADQAAIDAYTFTNSAGVVSKIQPGAKPGDIKFADLGSANGGAPDGKIDANDRYYMGSPIPDLTYSFNLNLDYKGFDLSLFMQGVQGNEIYAELVAWTQGMHNNFNVSTAALDRWTPTNTITNVPRAVRNDPNGNIMKISDRYIKDGAYFRLKNISLGYTIPKKWGNALHISNVRVYVTGRNLITFTKYPFYDPEIGSNAINTGGSVNTSRGIDNGYYPQPRTFISGIQVDF